MRGQKYSISIIAAIGRNRELGKSNKLLWHIPDELQRFKKITMGHPIIMGRKTFDSIGRVLPGRINIVITRNKEAFLKKTEAEGKKTKDLRVASSLEDALEIAKKEEGNDIIFIIGGGQIFEQALPLTDTLYLTLVDADFPDADVYFPEYKEFTKIVEREDHFSEQFRYSYLTLKRSN